MECPYNKPTECTNSFCLSKQNIVNLSKRRGTRNGLAIVHLARNLITQFGIVDLQIHKFLGTFGRQSVKYSPDSVAAQISPDSSLCLVRLPWSRSSRVTTLQLHYEQNRFTKIVLRDNYHSKFYSTYNHEVMLKPANHNAKAIT
ncbi:unnamed protein product [Rodentolepis nana]|uniref:CUB domain-containing protein n=1 Tax=Rodentolepis nana TaxID=102285 RepID=A0A0R3TL90_RODNA|nr:unnamed protein product [Rodentolepis nana]